MRVFGVIDWINSIVVSGDYVVIFVWYDIWSGDRWLNIGWFIDVCGDYYN